MRHLNRGIAAAALSAPLVLGMTGIAAADEFEQSSNQVGSEGASTSQVSANTGNGNGQASFEESQSQAGPDGASSSSTESSAGGGHDSDGLLGLGLLG